jgi:hypothetical protein
MPQSTAGSLKPIAVQQVTAPPLSEDARDASSEIVEYKIPIYVNCRYLLSVFENSMSSDLSSLLASSKALTSHLKRQDLPNVSLSLDQIEAQSRRLLPRQTGAQPDTGRG